MIRLKPKGGLCNRMRAIDSAVALSYDLERRLDIYWISGSPLNCPFHLLFEPIAHPLVYMHDLKFSATHWHASQALKKLGLPRRKNTISFFVKDLEILKAYDLQSVPVEKKILIESNYWFYDVKDKCQIFTPIASLQARIDERTKPFDAYTIGVHVRRTDNAISIANSPDDLFIAQMQHEVKLEPRTRFYLATDSMEVKQKFTHIFGDRIMTTPYQASRITREGVQEALVELYALSRTSKIIGSYWSSYSHTAADLGKINILKVMADTVETQ